MEKKNTVLLTVIAVATLLVAVVGATFAYFTATTGTNGSATNSATINTATVSGVTLNLGASTSATHLDYPGRYGFAGVQISAEKSGSENVEYRVTYNLNLSITNATGNASDLTWTLYKASSSVTDPNACTLQQQTNQGTGNNETHYYYTCTNGYASSFGTAVAGATGTVGASGTTEAITLTQDTDAADAYYYLVVTYANNENQNDDMGKAITVAITGVDTISTQQK